LKHYEFFGVERDDLDFLVIYFVVLAVFFHMLFLEILYYKVSIVIFQIVEDYGKEKLVAAAMCPGRFQLEITMVATGKEEFTREVMVTDLPISMSERLYNCRRRWRWCIVTVVGELAVPLRGWLP